jgi:hypothetical protein
MAITIIRKSVAPSEIISSPESEYTILDALKELQDKKQVLMLVHKSTGEDYQVLGYDPMTGRVCLKGKYGQKLNPCISKRECELYRPVWR